MGNAWSHSRRRFLNRLALGAGAAAASYWYAPGAFAEELVRTPAQMEGPFYPDKLPLDTDNDLLIINDSITCPSPKPRRTCVKLKGRAECNVLLLRTRLTLIAANRSYLK